MENLLGYLKMKDNIQENTIPSIEFIYDGSKWYETNRSDNT